MQKNITNIKDFIIQALTNGSEIKVKAENGDALSCFQMGMIHLLGIDTPLDFKKASKYLGNHSLDDNPEANRLLGFISECEGDYSDAFKRYASAADITGGEKGYISKVYEERIYLTKFFKKTGLPDDMLNKDLSQILNEYIKGGHSKIDACIKLVTICNDEPLYLEVAQNYFSIGDYYSARKWLLKGNIDISNHLYIYVKERLTEVEDAIKSLKDIDVIDVNGNSLLEKDHISFANTNDNNFVINKSERAWQASVSQIVDSVKRTLEEEERIRLQRIQEEARLKKLKEEEEALQMRLQEEEENRIRMLQEKQKSQEKQQAEEKAHIIELNVDYSNQQLKPDGQILKVWANNSGCLAAQSFDGMYQSTWDREDPLINEIYTINKTSTIGIFVHCDIVVNEQNDQTCRIKLKLTPLGIGNEIEGTVSFTPIYDNCEWEDFQINISIFQFGLKKDGRYSYEASMSLYDNMNNLLDTNNIQITIDYIHHMFKDDEIIVVS